MIGDQAMRPWFARLEQIFSICYILEIITRLFENGFLLFFWRSPDRNWNIFDFVVTASGGIDLYISSVTNSRSSGSTVCRVFRLLRVLRMFRALRLPALKEAEYVVVLAVEAVLKLSVLVGVVIWVSAIIVTNIFWDCENEEVRHMFGDLSLSMWSIFKLMTLDEWVLNADKVLEVQPEMKLFYIIFIFIAGIALMSLVPAIFIEMHMTSHEIEGRKSAERLLRRTLRKEAIMLTHLFHLVDVDGSGSVSAIEMERAMKSPDVLYKLKEAGLTEHGDLLNVRLGLLELLQEQRDEHGSEQVELTEEDFITQVLRAQKDLSLPLLC